MGYYRILCERLIVHEAIHSSNSLAMESEMFLQDNERKENRIILLSSKSQHKTETVSLLMGNEGLLLYALPGYLRVDLTMTQQQNDQISVLVTGTLGNYLQKCVLKRNPIKHLKI